MTTKQETEAHGGDQYQVGCETERDINRFEDRGLNNTSAHKDYIRRARLHSISDLKRKITNGGNYR